MNQAIVQTSRVAADAVALCKQPLFLSGQPCCTGPGHVRRSASSADRGLLPAILVCAAASASTEQFGQAGLFSARLLESAGQSSFYAHAYKPHC